MMPLHRFERYALVVLSALFITGLALHAYRYLHPPHRIITARSQDAAAVALSPRAPRLVDINTADEEALASLKGVGKVLAKRIVAYRASSGTFRTVDDLERVPGIGRAIVAANGDRIVTGAPSPTE